MTSNYSFRVSFSPEGGEFVGTCDSFPSLSFVAPTLGQAMTGIRKLVADCIADMRASDEPIPKPQVTR